MSFSIGSIVEGVVKGITKFGAFVLLPNGETGLVHISEIANTYVKDINEFLKVEDEVKVKVLTVGKEGRVGLSIKQAMETPPVVQDSRNDRSDTRSVKRNEYRSENRNDSRKDYRSEGRSEGRNDYRSKTKKPGSLTFEDKLSRFMKESDERQQDLKKNNDSKRGGRGPCRQAF